MTVIADRHRRLLEVLAAHDVDHVVVGGVALQLHGYSAETLDVDVTIAVDERNEQRVSAALATLHAAPYLVGARGSAYHTVLGQLEVMRTTDGVGGYAAWMRRAQPRELGDGLTVMVDLLASKEAAARDKDLAALPRIRAELLAAGAVSVEELRGPVAELDVRPPPDPAAVEVLGERPEDLRAGALWSHAADVVRDYRERWGLADDPRPLGPPTSAGDPQATDRAGVERRLRRTQRLLERAARAREDAGSLHRASFPSAPGSTGDRTAPDAPPRRPAADRDRKVEPER